MNITIETRIVAHPKRLEQAQRLAEQVGGIIFLDALEEGAKQNHLNALRAKPKEGTTHILILEDDALPVNNFKKKVQKVISENPDDLISLYLGTARPVSWQQRVDLILRKAPDARFVRLPKMIHAVAYCLPVEALKAFSPTYMKRYDVEKAADFSVGDAFLSSTSKKDIVYCVRSLVQHNDQGSLVAPWRAPVKRVARFLDED